MAHDDNKGMLVIFIGISFLAMFFFVYSIYWEPTLRPWWAEQNGKAELAQANQNRQIKVTEAMAENEAATSRAQAMIKVAQAQAQAEIERAKGVAEANRIIGESLKGHQEYLKYLYITGITTKDTKEVIYLPTESGLPILEAQRLN